MAVVLITGCSSGIGLKTALAFAKRGDTVFATMRDLSRAGELHRAADEEGLSVSTLEIDVSVDESVEKGVAAVLGSAGQIDVLVNNAGVAHSGSVELMPWNWLREQVEVNFFGAVRMIRAVLPGMRLQRSGAIINVSSAAARRPGVPASAFYSASKHALSTLSEALLLEVEGFGIRVVAIEPGLFHTELASKAFVDREPSPYADVQAKIWEVGQTPHEGVSDLSLVTDAIIEATSRSGPLHVPVGQDVIEYDEKIRGLTFEECANLFRESYGL